MASQSRPAKNAMRIDMPPPPLPQKKILEGEVNALANCYRNAVVKTGQVYEFHAKTRKLGIHQYAPHPPRSLTGALGREIEKFDQLCDAIESRLQRAVAVLQRDLERAEDRVKAAQAADPIQSRPPSPATETAPSSPNQLKFTDKSPVQSARRPSAISLSSLHRPTFQHKLDLSSLRLNPEDLMTLTSAGGLASPVTLAPKSARPMAANELPPDLMAALASSEAAASSNSGVDIDLTLDSGPQTDPLAQGTNIEGGVGSSADKPIELDLDIDMSDMQEMTSIFGEDGTTDVDALFSPQNADGSIKKEEEGIGMEILDAFTSSTEAGNNIFASIEAQGQDSINLEPGATAAVPSPGSLLANFSEAVNSHDDAGAVIPGAHMPFDIDSLDLENIGSNFLEASGSDMTLMAEFFKADGDDSNGAAMEGTKDG